MSATAVTLLFARTAIAVGTYAYPLASPVLPSRVKVLPRLARITSVSAMPAAELASVVTPNARSRRG